jgi:glycosyltransferase involved in cell wall biosynthesis
MSNGAAKGSIVFSFADPVGFSGQKAATELVLNGLARRGWDCRRLPLPVLKDSGRKTTRAGFLASLIAAWVRTLGMVGRRGAWLFISVGQSRFSFLRDLVPILVGRVALGRKRIIVPIHGSLFMRWAPGSFDRRAFQFLLGNVGLIAVNGERHKGRLVELGVDAHRVEIVVNSCEAEAMTQEQLQEKVWPSDRRAVRLLFLSSLIDTKGYPEYLEAVLRVSSLEGPAIEATVCGQFSASEFAERLKEPGTATAWIEEKIAAINRFPRSKARWIRGARGADKAALLRDADIFVLPTRYAVEAQPVSLLEAMASGCAIVTTRAGEIPTILDEESAVIVDSTDVDGMAAALQSLSTNAGRRMRLASRALGRFTDAYGLEKHLDRWESLLRR